MGFTIVRSVWITICLFSVLSLTKSSIPSVIGYVSLTVAQTPLLRQSTQDADWRAINTLHRLTRITQITRLGNQENTWDSKWNVVLLEPLNLGVGGRIPARNGMGIFLACISPSQIPSHGLSLSKAYWLEFIKLLQMCLDCNTLLYYDDYDEIVVWVYLEIWNIWILRQIKKNEKAFCPRVGHWKSNPLPDTIALNCITILKDKIVNHYQPP